MSNTKLMILPFLWITTTIETTLRIFFSVYTMIIKLQYFLHLQDSPYHVFFFLRIYFLVSPNACYICVCQTIFATSFHGKISKELIFICQNFSCPKGLMIKLILFARQCIYFHVISNYILTVVSYDLVIVFLEGHVIRMD